MIYWTKFDWSSHLGWHVLLSHTILKGTGPTVWTFQQSLISIEQVVPDEKSLYSISNTTSSVWSGHQILFWKVAIWLWPFIQSLLLTEQVHVVSDKKVFEGISQRDICSSSTVEVYGLRWGRCIQFWNEPT